MFLMYNGLTPEYVWSNGMVLFKFFGEDATKLADDYLSSGHATVNALYTPGEVAFDIELPDRQYGRQQQVS